MRVHGAEVAVKDRCQTEIITEPKNRLPLTQPTIRKTLKREERPDDRSRPLCFSAQASSGRAAAAWSARASGDCRAEWTAMMRGLSATDGIFTHSLGQRDEAIDES